ncbi:uncharacterized protein PAE49_010676 isoform 1-T3 [Odontesthes bonariensis]|uniref:uncharacterized protein LOC142388814 n=1 Tax=Odontesthes bonariensis TaxID=219752 RepID=UPI003F58AE39
MAFNDYCRLCKVNMRVEGIYGHSADLFLSKKPPSLFERLVTLGVTVAQEPGQSSRCCQRCSTRIGRLEKDIPAFRQWEEEFKNTDRNTDSNISKRPREPTPSKTPRALKKTCPKPPSPCTSSSRKTTTQVTITYPSQTLSRVCNPEEDPIIKFIILKRWKEAASHTLKHKQLKEELKAAIIQLIREECEALCSRKNDFILWRSTAADLKSFSFCSLRDDLHRLAPFLLSIFNCITNDNNFTACAAAAIAIRGRQPRLAAMSYYINTILQYGGAKKSVFNRLSQLSITTSHARAIRKQHEMALDCSVDFQRLKRATVTDTEEELLEAFRSMEDLHLSDESSEPSPRQEDSRVPTCPSSYSIIMDNLDFFIHRHNQSIDKSNKSIHWIHHIAVKDRIPTHHISNVKPITDIQHYNLASSLPQRSTQASIRRDFIVLGTRMLSKHMAAFESLADIVVHHIPHLYSTEMSTRSTDFPLGLYFKDETQRSDLVEVLRHIQEVYMPKDPDGAQHLFIGGDRLTEANCRNAQWGFSDGDTEEERMEGMYFKFEDWHAIRVLFEIHHKIFFKDSAKDHGTLFANMTKLR